MGTPKSPKPPTGPEEALGELGEAVGVARGRCFGLRRRGCEARSAEPVVGLVRGVGRAGDGETGREQVSGVPVAKNSGPKLVAVSRTAADGATEAVNRVRDLAVDGHLRAHLNGGGCRGVDGAR